MWKTELRDNAICTDLPAGTCDFELTGLKDFDIGMVIGVMFALAFGWRLIGLTTFDLVYRRKKVF